MKKYVKKQGKRDGTMLPFNMSATGRGRQLPQRTIACSKVYLLSSRNLGQSFRPELACFVLLCSSSAPSLVSTLSRPSLTWTGKGCAGKGEGGLSADKPPAEGR